MAESIYLMQADGVRLEIDLSTGSVWSLTIERDGREVTPLHRAPWIDEPDIAGDASLPLHVRRLSGDFFCAPFGKSDLEAAPLHGWSANWSWSHIGSQAHPSGGVSARFELDRPILGARLVKEITLRDFHPFVYQRHIFEGGSGAVPVASHAMTRFAGGGRLFFSPKAYGETLEVALEPDPSRGRSALRYPSRFADLGAAPLANGGHADLQSYPFASRHEDFVMLVEAARSRLGWAAALRENERDVFLSLKNPADFPVTFLWFSNGGRDYRPWNGRHFGVLGIEEGRSWSARGHRASSEPNAMSREGIPSALQLGAGEAAEVRHVIGGIPLGSGWSDIQSITAAEGALVINAGSAEMLQLPFDSEFLATRRQAVASTGNGMGLV